MSTEQTSKNIFTYLNGLNWSKVKANLDEIFDFFSKVSVITWQSVQLYILLEYLSERLDYFGVKV